MPSTLDRYFRFAAEKGLKNRGLADSQEHVDRLNYELDVIEDMGFSGYFLVVQDFVDWAKKRDILVGPGRGSGSGALIAYVLRITEVEPMKYGLIFERFLNAGRAGRVPYEHVLVKAEKHKGLKSEDLLTLLENS